MKNFDNYPHGYTTKNTKKIPDKFIKHIENARLSARKFAQNDLPNRLKVNLILGEMTRNASYLNGWDIDNIREREIIHEAMDFVADYFDSIGL